MLLQYASDLHLEFERNRNFLKKNPLIPTGEVLLLAGDIMLFGQRQKHEDFFSFVSDNFNSVYWVPGNHEYYHFDAATKCGTFHEKIRENVFLVNNTTAKHGDVTLVFSTLWSKISPAHQWEIERKLSDFRLISFEGHRFSADRFNQFHEESLAFVTKELKKENRGKMVVVTHHIPTYQHYPAQYKGDVLNEAFATELSGIIESIGPDVWIYGHHHHNASPFTIGKTRMLTNQLGYVEYNEHQLFDPKKCFEV